VGGLRGLSHISVILVDLWKTTSFYEGFYWGAEEV